MKQNDTSQLATKNDLKELGDKIDKRFTAIDKLINKLDKNQQLYLKIAKIDTQVIVNQAIAKFTKTLAAFADKIYTRMDPLLQELETSREHRIIAAKDDYETKKSLE